MSESEVSAAALECALRHVVAGAKGTFAFYVHDLDGGVRVAIRAGESFPAASVIKLPILLRALEMVAAGEARLDQRLRLTAWHKTGGSGVLQHFHDGLEMTLEDACTAMIALSDNTATNVVLDVTGVDSVNALLDRLGCPRTRLHRYLGKPDMPGPAGPNQAVPREIGWLLEMLVRREILTPELCQTAMVMLRRQNHRALIPRLLPERTAVAHKTGSLDGVRHDVGILWRPDTSAGTSLGARAHGSAPPDAGGAATPAAVPGVPSGVMHMEKEGFAPGHPVVLVAMSRDVADLRWTVENEAERTIAQAAKVIFDHLVKSAK
jgi:beta-lactamase class A